MLVLVAALFLTTVAGLPAQEPIVAVIPPGGNLNVSLVDASHSSSIQILNPIDESLYHKIELHFLDFQMNQTAPVATNLVQNVEIFVNVTFGNHKTSQNGANLAESGASSVQVPNSPQGYTQLFNGLYNGLSDNKIAVDKTIAFDMCGFSFEKGYMDVWVRPTNRAAAGAFHEGLYTCFLNWNFGNKIVHAGEASWSSIFQCNSDNLNNYSFRLWYQMRFYNIDPKTCQSRLQPILV